jgi:hypothetical protein
VYLVYGFTEKRGFTLLSCVLFALTASNFKFKYKVVGTTGKIKPSDVLIQTNPYMSKRTQKSRETLSLQRFLNMKVRAYTPPFGGLYCTFLNN